MNIHIPLNEKYRPQKIEDVILNSSLKEKFIQFIETKNIPNLLFVGPPGTGKTTVAKILTKSITNDYLIINSSEKRGIDTLRNEIIDFCSKTSFDDSLKIVFLDEFDNTTFDTMSAMRGVMEEFIQTTRFILTGNYKNRIIDAIVSRCQVFDFSLLQKKEIAQLCFNIIKKENISFSKENIQEEIKFIIQKFYPDIRSIIGFIEKNTINNYFSINKENIQENYNVKQLLIQYIKDNNWKAIRLDLCKKERLENLYKYIFDNAEEISKEKAEIIMILAAEGMKDHLNVLDPEINFISTILKIINQIKQ